MPVLPNAALPGNSLEGSFGSQVGQAVRSSLLGSVGLSSRSNAVNVADMFKYSQKTTAPAPRFVYPNADQDWRVRISLPAGANYFYNDPNNSLLSPLRSETVGSGGGGDFALSGLANSMFGGAQRVGVIFPYTPQVQISHTANYNAQKLTHNNYTQYYYQSSEVSAISISGDFTVQNVNEGQYLLACIYFFRSVTKMFFGSDPADLVGNPPPIVYLNGYGQYYLPNVPCVVTSFSHTMPSEVDYMDIPEPGLPNYNPQLTGRRMNSTRLPTTSSMTVSLQPVYSRTAQSQNFSLQDFSNGALINPPGSGAPASAFGASHGSQYAGNNKKGGFL
jgi:hypothetical protein